MRCENYASPLMIKSLHKYLTILIVALTSCLASSAAVNVTASLDSASILMGRVDTLRLFVERDANRQGVFPLFNKVPQG